MLRRIYEKALQDNQSYPTLYELATRIGARLSGSAAYDSAVQWGVRTMQQAGFDTVFLQPVMVPKWVRGAQEKALAFPKNHSGGVEMKVRALGNSVGTGEKGLRAKVVEVQNFDELAAIGQQGIRGKIVFFNRPMDPTIINTFMAYGAAANQRTSGPSEAAKYGAVGVVVRSVTQYLDDEPHTGALRYALNIPKIPAVAISTKGAEQLSNFLKTDPDTEFYFETHCQQFDDVQTFNVIGEMRGFLFPEERILVGGHLDSWDLGQGAHDDGAGCVHSIEAVRLLKALGYMPNRTLRCVLFANEENGLRGGIEYAKVAAEQGIKHLAAIESDRGGFLPLGFLIDAAPDSLARIQQWAGVFKPYNVTVFDPASGVGADISPLKNQGVPLIGFYPDSQPYFRFHHTDIDRMEYVDPRHLQLGSATISSLIYLLDRHGLPVR